MSQTNFRFGAASARRWLQTGEADNLNSIFADARSDEDARRAAGEHAMLGALTAIADTLHHVQAAGVVFSPVPPTSDHVIYARSCGEQDYARVAQSLIDSVGALRQRCPALTITWPMGARAEDGAPNHVEQTANPEPLKIQIVSMPERRTETEVQRDKDGDITSSTQVERDAA